MIDVDGFRFGTVTTTVGIEWDCTLPFSEITELEYKATGGRVSGTLRDGTELVFRIDQVLAGEEAMRTVEALLDPETDSDVESVADAATGERIPVEWSESVEVAFADAAQHRAEPQVRRFARLATDAGLVLRYTRVMGNGTLFARWPGMGTSEYVFSMRSYSESRFHILAFDLSGFRAGASEVSSALPKTGMVRKMDVAEADRYLDALEAFLATHSSGEIPDHVGNGEELTESSSDAAIERSAVTASVVSDDEFAAALEALEEAFKDAAECAAEPQARRFAELTAAADLKVEWVGGLSWLEARLRETGKLIFRMGWIPEGGFVVELGRYRYFKDGPAAGVAFGESEAGVWRAFPVRDYTTAMDSAEVDRFLDALEAFFASHSLPSKEDDARLEREEGGCLPLILVLLTPIWGGVTYFLLNLMPGEFPWGTPVGMVVVLVLWMAVPVLGVFKGLAARREILRSDGGRVGIGYAWAAIILGTLITVAATASVVVALIDRFTRDL